MLKSWHITAFNYSLALLLVPLWEEKKRIFLINKKDLMWILTWQPFLCVPNIQINCLVLHFSKYISLSLSLSPSPPPPSPHVSFTLPGNTVQIGKFYLNTPLFSVSPPLVGFPTIWGLGLIHRSILNQEKRKKIMVTKVTVNL